METIILSKMEVIIGTLLISAVISALWVAILDGPKDLDDKWP